MRQRIILSIFAAVLLQTSASGPVRADPPRHWFFDHYRTYEGEAFDYRAQPRIYRPRAYDFRYDAVRNHPWRERRVRYDLSPSLSDKAARKMQERRPSRALYPPPRPREKPVADDIQTATVSRAAPDDPAIRQETATPPATRPEAAAGEPRPGAISCADAQGIIAGFGFTDIQARSCSGEQYSFAATRGGKPFTIKLSSANGELTEVNRQ